MMGTNDPQQFLKIDSGAKDLNWLTLAFSGASAGLEEPFRVHYVQRTLLNIRFAILMAAVMYGGFGFLDALLLPSHLNLTLLIRFTIVCPVLLAGFGATFIPWLHRYLQLIMTFLFVFAGLGIVYMIICIPPPMNYYYYAGLILVYMFGYCFIYLRFLWASLGGWIIFVAYEVAAFLTDTPSSALINNSFFLASANLSGMLVCYTIDYASRNNYFLMHLLAKGQRKIEEAKEQLERRVAERTEELMNINQQLSREINERMLAEQEQRRLETQLKQAEKMEAIGSLAAGVAHDLNNILVGLVSLPDLMLMDLPKDNPLRPDIIKLQNSGKRAAAIVQDLLTMARLGVADRMVINLNQIVSEYLQASEYQRLEQDHPHVRIVAKHQEDLLNIRASAVQITKVLMNLVTNACEATLIEGTITIETSNRYLEDPLEVFETIPVGEYVVLSVRDSGVGMPADNRHMIFEPFYTKKRLGRSGTGLGMTVVWHTVKEIQGYIDVQSTEGKGTTFELYFPVSREDVEHIPARVSIDDCRGHERVLVVDDDAEQRDIAASILSQLGYQVFTAESGEKAVDLVKDQTIDIAVLDMIMDPGIDGCETYRRIREIAPELRTIIVSGYSETEQVREAQQLGAGAYVKKPYTLEKIALAIRAEMSAVKL